MKIPAVTIVAAWISAEIGVGPSIESGSQTWNGNWADLPIAPTKRKRQIAVMTSQPVPGKVIIASCSRDGENVLIVQRTGKCKDQPDPDNEPEIAHTVDEESFQTG